MAGRHTEMRVCASEQGDILPTETQAPLRQSRSSAATGLDRAGPATMNRMWCKAPDGKAWTTVRVRELRERLGIAPFDPSLRVVETLSVVKAATRLGICVGSVYGLIRTGLLPATQLMRFATSEIPAAALEAGPAKAGVREIVNRRPNITSDSKRIRP